MSDRTPVRKARPPPAGASRSVVAAEEDSTGGAQRRNGASWRRTPVDGRTFGAGAIGATQLRG